MFYHCWLWLSSLQEHAADPVKGWRAKDCAVYLVMAVTVRGKTGELGATSTNRLVNISDFFAQQVGLTGQGH
jgi:exportin-2 (importin alpha re-exporter)